MILSHAPLLAVGMAVHIIWTTTFFSSGALGDALPLLAAPAIDLKAIYGQSLYLNPARRKPLKSHYRNYNIVEI
jgi:hypothetical protein